jgi:hypothetical protein
LHFFAAVIAFQHIIGIKEYAHLQKTLNLVHGMVVIYKKKWNHRIERKRKRQEQGIDQLQILTNGRHRFVCTIFRYDSLSKVNMLHLTKDVIGGCSVCGVQSTDVVVSA